MLNWANQFSIFSFLDNNHYSFDEPEFECLLAIGCKECIENKNDSAFSTLQEFITNQKSNWLFGHLSYDLKNEIETLNSNNNDAIGFNVYSFFVPEIIIQLKKNECTILASALAKDIYIAIENVILPIQQQTNTIAISSRFSKEEYLATIHKLQEHIHRGDCYEINFCQEFFSENITLNIVDIFKKLSSISPTPFAALYKYDNKYCICASPERYLKKEGNHILSQPIKGTAKRNHDNIEEDIENKNALLHSQKEKSENVMVVDLVRNDLSKICKEGTVQVDELFGIYSFPQVHQMISTVSGELKNDLKFTDIIKATFPMGSMTGAPKKRVMQLIEQYEKTKRGLFSGSIGYIMPNGNFDFNVVIRSIFYNADSGYLSYQTGGAITAYSIAEKEYEECLLKAEAILQAIN